MRTLEEIDKELNFHLEIVLSNLDERVAEPILRARGQKILRRLLLDSFHSHPPGCQGGYSYERCPCAVAAKGLNTLLAVTFIDEARIVAAKAQAR